MIDDVKKYLNHREPFLLVDGVVNVDKDKIHAYKDVQADDPILKGHFPGNPVFPGVLTIEALAQAACILIRFNQANQTQYHTYLTKIDDARFKKLIKPGNRLDLHVSALSCKSMKGNLFYSFDCKALENAEIAVSCTISAVAALE